jgi:hypothetical protein
VLLQARSGNTGMMEYWNDVREKNQNLLKPNIPIFHYSNCERSELSSALGSCGEFHACYDSFKQASQITDKEYEKLDQLHYKVENALLKLIESLQKKQKDKQWEDNLQSQ